MENTRAPGPWFVEGKSIKSYDHGRGYTVARVDNKLFTPEANAGNAALIAAAPELLEALEALTRILKPYMGQGRMDDQINAALEAIARARGEP